jgi:hypothetical protein
MALKSKAQLTTELLAIITGMTSPDSITPTTDGGERQDIIDSFISQVETGGLTLADFIVSIVTPLLSGGIAVDINAFRASKTVDQPCAGAAATGYKIHFEDDITPPNFDNGNRFLTNEYVFSGSITKRFAWEKQIVTSINSGTYKLRILKNGAEVAASETITAATQDVYGHSASGTGYEFEPFYFDVAGVSGDKVTWEVYCITTAGTALITAKAGGVISTN